MSKKDVYTTDVSDNEKINQEVIDTEKDKNKKSPNVDNKDKNKKSTNVDNTIKSTTSMTSETTESKKHRRIPDWLPEKDNVEIVEPIDKPPHLRSKVNLL